MKRKHNRQTRKAIAYAIRMQALRAMNMMEEYLHQSNYKSREKNINKEFFSYIVAICCGISLVMWAGNHLNRTVAIPTCLVLWLFIVVSLLFIRFYFKRKDRYYQKQKELVQERWNNELSKIS